MLVSVITVSRNAASSIEATIKSVRDQDYDLVEHIFIDALSTDGTREIIKSNCRKNDYFVSEGDEGIYDAMNKGIDAATGEIICILNADDCFADGTVISKVVNTFKKSEVKLVYSDIAYVNRKMEIKRKWKAGEGSPIKTKLGWHPPHPGVFVCSDVYEIFGLFNTTFKIAADYDFLVRVLKNKRIRSHYLEFTTVHMMDAGVSSSLKGRLLGLKEVIISLAQNGLTLFIPFLLFHRYSQKVVQILLGRMRR